MLKIEKIHTYYGPIEALKGLDMEIHKGEIVTLIGSNGAGKSTCLRSISGIHRPGRGRILLDGRDITETPAHEIVGMGISHVPEGRRIFPRLTVLENLEMGAYSGRADYRPTLERVYKLFPVLEQRSGQYGGTLSGGEQQMLAIGRALMSGPDLLLLDEPSLGLAPIMVGKIFKTISEINREGVTILLVEQNASAALRLAARGYVLENGRVALSGDASELLGNEEVRRAYLGE